MQQTNRETEINNAIDLFEGYYQVGLKALKAFEKLQEEAFFALIDERDGIFDKFKSLDNFLQLEYKVDLAQINKVQNIWKDLNKVNENIYRAIDQFKTDLHQKTLKLDHGMAAIEQYHCMTEDDQEKFKRIN